MCKVLMLSNGSNLDKAKLQKFINISAKLIGKTEKDGFGWVAMGKKGIFGEKGCSSIHYRYQLHRNYRKADIPIIKETYRRIGVQTNITGPVLVHGRTSTNKVCIENTHPLTEKGAYLIHNGVVENEGNPYKQATTCDTEHLVHYLTNGGIDAIEKNVSGYFAFGSIMPNGELHISKCDLAPLKISFCEEIDSYIFATTAELINDLRTHMKWKKDIIDDVKDNIYFVMKGNTFTFNKDINPIGYSVAQSKHFSKTNYDNWSDWEHGHDGYEKFNRNVVENYLEVWNNLNVCDRIYDVDGVSISLQEFRQLTTDAKMMCEIYDSQGFMLYRPEY